MLYTSFETNIHSAEMDRAVYPWQQGCRVCHWGVTMIDILFAKKTDASEKSEPYKSMCDEF